jgi:formylmethanofuran dehydrogenase subunit B
VDGLLWITSFAADRLPPPSRVPKIVLGPPTLQALMNEPGAPALALTDCVFIPVATPGLNAAGHLFRTDGTVVLPVHPLRDDGLPGVAQVLDMIRSHLPPAARLRSGL